MLQMLPKWSSIYGVKFTTVFCGIPSLRELDYVPGHKPPSLEDFVRVYERDDHSETSEQPR